MESGPLIVIVGETGSGKSSLALDIARRFDGEVIGADSWTVYRDFNIGTAKPSPSERSEVPHHLFDIVDAPEGFNAALFKNRARQAISAIHKNGKIPILVGGTGLYIDSILFDYSFLPPGRADERNRLNGMSLVDVVKEARSKGVNLEGIDLRNKRRVIRAIETNGLKPQNSVLRANTLVLGISIEREQLRQRITGRVDTMMAAGLEREVSGLIKKYGWGVEPMKGIGYYEWKEYFLGAQTKDQTRERIIADTLKLAKRQRTWFKRNNSIHWLNNRDNIDEIVTTFLNKKA